MSHKKMTVLEAIEYIENNDGKAFGFRGDDFIPARKFRRSKYQGDDGRTRIQVSGVSTVGVSSIIDRRDIIASMEMARSYGDNIFLLECAPRHAEVGEDFCEIIMCQHKIVGIIEVNFVRDSSKDLDWPWVITDDIPEKPEPEAEKSPKQSFEEWSRKAFREVKPNAGIFASQYASYLKRNGYSE